MRPFLPATIQPFVAFSFFPLLGIQSCGRISERLLVTAEPSVPAILPRDNATVDKALRPVPKMTLIAQDGFRVAQFFDL
jgi:hypothetical protein